VTDSAPKADNRPLTIDALVDIALPAEPQLAPDGSRVAFVHPAAEGRQVFTVPVPGWDRSGNQPVWPLRITSGPRSGESPNWSPDASKLALIRDKALVVVAADGSNVSVLTEHQAGNATPRWSPDGSQIAFYSRRLGWSQIWVIDASGGEPRRLTSAPADNDDLQWSPEGTQIAYSSIRGDDLNNRDIYCVDLATSTERRLTAAPNCFDGAPSWSQHANRIAFLSDQDGWIHVYTMAADGSDRRQLTSGEFEDGWPTLSRGHLLWAPDGSQLAFVRNRGGCLDLMLVEVAGGACRRVNAGDGFYQPSAWLPDGSGLIALVSRPNQPSEVRLISLDGTEQSLTRSLQGGLYSADFALPDRVSFRNRDGLVIEGHLYRPRSASAGAPCPAIVHPHGGPTYQSYYAWPDPAVQLFVQEGYAVFEPDFRGSSGYGREFRFANSGDWGAGDARDCIDAALFLRGQDWVDPARIGIWGASYGGYLALCCLVESPSTFRAAIDMFGDSEISESYRRGDRAGRLDLHRQMGAPEANSGAYRTGSPVYRAERIESPLLILHGRDDARVVPAMSERMIEALKIEGKFFEHHFYDGEGHGFRRPENRRDAYDRMLKFLDKYLKA
jgi:dipeptidyl aminopeptidase/acylaminoacyl peptidase